MKLENLNLVELDSKEIINIDGGIAPPPPHWGWFALGIAVIDFFHGLHNGIHEGIKCNC